MVTDALPEIPVFDGLKPEQLEELNGWLRRMEFEPGHEIVREGAPSDGLYVLARGKATALKTSSLGPVRVAELEGPTVFGEMGLLTGESRSASVVSQSRVVAAMLPIDLFEEKIGAGNLTAYRIAFNLGRIASHRMKEALQRILRLSEALAQRRLSDERHEHITQILDSICREALVGQPKP